MLKSYIKATFLSPVTWAILHSPTFPSLVTFLTLKKCRDD